jgi:hypothetical protein
VTQVGADMVVSIDRDGAGGAYNMTTLITLTNTSVPAAVAATSGLLDLLLANHQIVVG